ncbi:MAG TPA: formate dehydrogenase accessory sulfurtransferase FdhD [Methanoregulaceae archaeon]|nr:formate dehydrogenase accessory sulfurtransferase FdhD [Methanoregulaceae archaeon]HPD74629.1 formate dehydrogenase accessory sulfurtransferase FdhD [Methanoregulaceae archaeon]HRY74899.1 formate dehydrogenase accessory sulfurtransferase FdhD [Methanoregulaceae archaeon]
MIRNRKAGEKTEPVSDEMDPVMFRNIPAVQISGEDAIRTTHEVIEEIPFALFINGRHAMTAMMSPVQLEDFVTGYLFTEQIIKGVDEIESIRIEKNRISVLTKNLFKVVGPKKTILSGCGGSTSYIDTEKLPKIQSDLTITPQMIRDRTKEGMESDLHVKTGGIHVVILSDREKILARAEDIGRHNAMDRVIGFGLRTGIDFSQTFTVCSGRISSEMARKCLTANIPIMISRGATTTLAIDIAQKTGLTVVAFARSQRMMIYTNPERIEGALPL